MAENIITLIRGDDSNFLNETLLIINFSSEDIDLEGFKAFLTIENSHNYTKKYDIKDGSVEIILNKCISSTLDIGVHRCNIKLIDTLGRIRTVKNFNIKVIDDFSIDEIQYNEYIIDVGFSSKDYNMLFNKPSINNIELSGNKTLEELGIQHAGNYSTIEYVNTLTENINSEIDSLELKVNKKSDIDYVDNELALKADKIDLNIKANISDIPTKVSQLVNDEGYLTEHQDISNKADIDYVEELLDRKSDKASTYTKVEVNTLIDDVNDNIELKQDKLTAGNVIKFVDYIITDGSSYIDTEYYPNDNTYIEYTFEIVKAPTTVWNGLFGSRQDTAYYTYNIFCRNSLNLRLDYGRYEEIGYQTSLNTKYTIKAGLGEIYINDELVKSYTSQLQGTSPYPMYLGNFNNKGTPYATGTAQKIYPCPIYENGVLVRDFKPCVVAGEAGLYDMVTGKVFTNAGTGTLKASGRFVTSILFDGNSYINTDIAHQTCTIEVTLRFEETGNRQLMGFGSSSGQYWGKSANQTSFEYFSGTNAMDKTDVVLEYMCDDPTTPYIIMHADGKSRTGTADTKLSEIPYMLGCLKNSLTNTTMYYPCTMEVWGQKTTIGGEVVQDLRPYVDDNGVACFKDVVTNTLFYNQGTGTLGYTE